jgi:hypothetical protein
MKKLLLTAFIAFTFTASAQVLQSDNFDAYTVGNVGTMTDGTVEGQGGWLQFVGTGSDNTDNNNFQIIAGTGTDKDFKITGSSIAGGTRFMWKDGLVSAWENRVVGNDIIEVEFDYYTGGTTTSLNDFRVYIYSDEATPKVLAGIGVSKNLVVSGTSFKNVVRGFCHWTSTPGTGTYSIGLGASATEPATLPEDTTVRLGFSFNKTTAEVIWRSNAGLDASFSGNANFPMVTAGINPGEVNFLGVAGTGNTVASSAEYDNFVVKASATDQLLSAENSFATANFSVFPNPATDVVNVNAGNLVINSIQVTDLNGRVINTINVNASSTAQVNISELMTGIYFLTVNTDQGVGTSKIVKK